MLINRLDGIIVFYFSRFIKQLEMGEQINTHHYLLLSKVPVVLLGAVDKGDQQVWGEEVLYFFYFFYKM